MSQPCQYIEPVFRPPSEARSFILQVTNGCSWNKCTFCEMYTAPQKKFKPTPVDEVEQEIQAFARFQPGTKRVFLADGDAMTLSYRRLEQILGWLNQHFPHLERVSAYCLPRNLKNKTVEELRALQQLRLDILYVGAESGDDLVLHNVKKGETQETTVAALNKIREAGLRSSVMILTGLGGNRYWRQHAIHSAEMVNLSQPDYVSTLVVSFPMGEARFRENFDDFDMCSQKELLMELECFIQHTQLKNSVFRSDHASNYLVLKGVLGRDKELLLRQVRAAIEDPAAARLRPEWARGL